MAALLVWVTFPGGGAYPFVWVPWLSGTLLLAAFVRPEVASTRQTRPLDLLLVASAAAIAFQVVPLPVSVLQLVDPNALPLRANAWLAGAAADGRVTPLPISIVPAHTLEALAIVAGGLVTFWTCRTICERGGAGRIVRAVAIVGLVASVAAIVQRARSEELLYGIWRPLDAGARPYGPFVNRNHFATWIVLACPLVFGYILARTPESRAERLSQRLVDAIKQLGSIRTWLISAVCVMTVAVMISASRSGFVSLAAALTASAWLSKRRSGKAVLRWTMLQGALLVIVVMAFASFDPLAARLDEMRNVEGAGRSRKVIWEDARRVAGDFTLTGTGAGTFGTAVGPYQTAAPGFSIGHAHNHYLQVAAEGGLLVGLPAALAAGAFFVLFIFRMTEDTSSNYLMRAGAAAGLAGVLLQSVWETGVRMPANAMLFAILAAIATYTPEPPRRAD